ncbi:MAG TPA: beta-phosphoglucomutase family hydrolase [Gammaproteobacteria bacterium]|jgi:alpha,alpha-trehalase|nr:beta-phosphoglucomutase family hydrolase [Gammaproteobacteria bacterium]
MSTASIVLVLSRAAFDVVLFDLDGVITQTAKVHVAAWEAMFNDYLKRMADLSGEPYRPFDPDSDYRRYVNGRPRYEGVKSFLAARGITLPYGKPSDPPEQETVCGLGNRKNKLFLAFLKKGKLAVYPTTLDLIRQLRSKRFRIAVVSASENCGPILEAAHIADLFEVRVDGLDIARLPLKGKPAPDTFLEAARRLAVAPKRAVVVEDAIAGVEAGRAGRFGCVIGVDRTGHPEALKEAGADVVVQDLAEIGVE